MIPRANQLMPAQVNAPAGFLSPRGKGGRGDYRGDRGKRGHPEAPRECTPHPGICITRGTPARAPVTAEQGERTRRGTPCRKPQPAHPPGDGGRGSPEARPRRPSCRRFEHNHGTNTPPAPPYGIGPDMPFGVRPCAAPPIPLFDFVHYRRLMAQIVDRMCMDVVMIRHEPPAPLRWKWPREDVIKERSRPFGDAFLKGMGVGTCPLFSQPGIWGIRFRRAVRWRPGRGV